MHYGQLLNLLVFAGILVSCETLDVNKTDLTRDAGKGVAETPGKDTSPPRIVLRGENLGVNSLRKVDSPSVFQGSTRRVSSVSFSRDGSLLATGSDDTNINIWNIRTGARETVLKGHTDGIIDVAFSFDGSLLVSGGWDRKVIIWDIGSGKKIKRMSGHREGVTAVRFTPNNKNIISASMDGTIRIWHARTGKKLAVLKGHDTPVNTIAVSPDGKLLLSGGADKMVRLWDLDALSEIKNFSGTDGVVKSILFDHDAKTFYSAGIGNHINKWDLESSQIVKRFGDNLPTVNSMSLSHNGALLVSADTTTTRIWDTKTGSEIGNFNKHKGLVSSVMFSPISNQIASAGSDKLIKLWHPTNLKMGDHTKSVEITTIEPIVWITGEVFDQSKIAQVMIGDHIVEVGSNNTFRLKRTVPIGESTLTLAAFDEWGNKSTARILVNRVIPASTLPPLEPDKIRGEKNPKAVAIIIGIEKYNHLPAAKYAENDARLFYDYAVNSMGIPQDRIKPLIGRGASRGEILKTLTNWVPSKQIDAGSDVFFYYAGHGLANPDGNDALILPVDGDSTTLSDTAIPRKRIFEELAKLNSRSTTLFLDTCYSGVTRGGASLLEGRPVIVIPNDEELPPPGVTLIAAAGNNEISKTLKQPKHGIFSYFLMKALEGDADSDEDGTITTREIFDFVRPRVVEQSANLGGKQEPQYYGDDFTVARGQ